MKQVIKKTNSTLLATAAIVLLTGCGATKLPNEVTESSMSSVSDSDDSTQSVDVGALARCVSFDHTFPGTKNVKGFVTAFATNGGVDRSRLRFIFKEVPTGITDGSQFLNAFGIYTSQNSSLQSTSALGFAFISRFNGSIYNVSSPVKALTRSTIQSQFINANNLQNSFTVENFFSKAILVVVGLSHETQAIKLQVYNSSSSQAVTSPMLNIVPSKYLSANPYRYHSNTANSVLANLHPYTNDMVDISLTQALQEDSSFYSKSEQVCQQAL